MSKYGARKTEFDGIVYDSKKEARRAAELRLLLRAGEIKQLREQVPFVLIPEQNDETGKVIEKPVKYIADFTYIDARTGQYVVEDTKGVKTKDYVIKRKLMLWTHKIRIREV